jgi:uncharacterized protein YecE (DUF72 family)
LERRVGTAGWTLPRNVRERFDGDGTQLERYARRFSCVEIDSSFYRPHRVATYVRWAASVPDDFRFALKLPQEVTHTRRLAGVDEPLARFLDESAGLGAKRDVLLVQLAPSLAYDRHTAEPFFTLLREHYAGRVACEPRHATWLNASAEALFAAFQVARVAADPPRPGGAFVPGGTADFQYWRLHGSPRIYYSDYGADKLAEMTRTLRQTDVPAWCIFDNTALGAATANALDVLEAL